MNAFFQQFLASARRNPVMVFSIAMLLVAAVAYYFVERRQAELTARHDRVRAEGDAVLLALTGHSRIQSQLAVVQEALDRINRNLVVENDLAGNLDYFYQIEKSTRVHLSDLNQLSSQPVEGDSPYKTVPFSLRMSGQYYQLISFLHELETGPRLVKVKGYNFSRRDPAADLLSLDLNVEVLAAP